MGAPKRGNKQWFTVAEVVSEFGVPSRAEGDLRFFQNHHPG